MNRLLARVLPGSKPVHGASPEKDV